MKREGNSLGNLSVLKQFPQVSMAQIAMAIMGDAERQAEGEAIGDSEADTLHLLLSYAYAKTCSADRSEWIPSFIPGGVLAISPKSGDPLLAQDEEQVGWKLGEFSSIPLPVKNNHLGKECLEGMSILNTVARRFSLFEPNFTSLLADINPTSSASTFLRALVLHANWPIAAGFVLKVGEFLLIYLSLINLPRSDLTLLHAGS